MYILWCMGLCAVWRTFKHVKLHVCCVQSCWDSKSLNTCLHHTAEEKAPAFYFLHCSLHRVCTLVESSGCLVSDLWSPAAEDLEPGKSEGTVSQQWGKHHKGVFPVHFLCFPPGNFEQVAFQLLVRALGFLTSLSAGRLDQAAPSRVFHSTGCSSHCKCTTLSHGCLFLKGMARPVLGGAMGRLLSPLLLSATANPGTSPHLKVLTPITGPQAYHVVTCSEIDVERCGFGVTSCFCLKHLLYCVLSCCLLFPQTRTKPEFCKPSLILFTWCF